MTMRNCDLWQKPLPLDVSDVFLNAIGGHELVSHTLHRRGIEAIDTARAFLNSDLYHPTPAAQLPDMAQAVAILRKAITTGDKILIWGDFDVDGQTSTALLLGCLTELGVNTVFYIPHRLTESHGITVPRLEKLVAEHQPAILLTCDTGITEHSAVDYANSAGITTIITDHHDLPDGPLPAAAACIDPKRLPKGHALYTLPGVGVAYKLMEALFEASGHVGAITDYLDLVAMGIVADVAEQVRDTRYLLQRGLERLRSTRRVGIQALCSVANLLPENITTESIGFQIAPRLNAIGRLDEATRAVILLSTDNKAQATEIAAQLDGLNRERQVKQKQMMSAAEHTIAQNPQLMQHTALVIYHDSWHPGLLGIVAGQLAEKYARPCVLLSVSDNGIDARGSARSALGFDIGSAIASQAALLNDFGGHPGAAGLSLPVENIDRFRRGLSKALDGQASTLPDMTVRADAEVTLSDITPDFVEDIYRLAPFGEGNPPLNLSASSLKLVKVRHLGREKLHRKLTIEDATGHTQDVLWWNARDSQSPTGTFDLLFTVGWNIYQNQKLPALTLVDIFLHEQTAEACITSPEITLIDWRKEPASSAIDAFLTLEPDGIIWAEDQRLEKMAKIKPRTQLKQAPALLVYTTPPLHSILTQVVDLVAPERLYILSTPPQTESIQKILWGMAKRCIAHDEGVATIAIQERMAQRIAQPRAAVTWGLRYFAASGQLAIEESPDAIKITAGSEESLERQFTQADAKAAFTRVLSETTSYRTFFQNASIETIL